MRRVCHGCGQDIRLIIIRFAAGDSDDVNLGVEQHKDALRTVQLFAPDLITSPAA